ncbi:MAG: hypothetical protein JJ863_04645 [Deltaproteobacteria bacterium]|nr:hypothetical protein [Deltaproteobacteria bacterium]
MIARPLFACLLATALVACGDDDSSDDPDTDMAVAPDLPPTPDGGPEGIIVEEGCDNTQDLRCFLPWPSSVFLTEDSDTETGFRVDMPENGMPYNQYGEIIDRTIAWEKFDGFSPAGSLIAGFWGKVDDSPLADETMIPATLEASSQTLLIDAETGELVAHFAEVDKWRNDDDGTTSLYMRPATRLQENHRYVAAIKMGLELEDGSTVEPSEFFRALRDGTGAEEPAVEARRAAMEEIFGFVEDLGVNRSDLLLAWDFHTASGNSIRGDMLTMWDDAKTKWEEGTDGIGTCTVESVEMDVNETLWKRIRGTFTVPNYMTGAGGGVLANRDASGTVTYNGTLEAPFEIAIPPSVRDRVMAGEGPGRGMMHGHGLLGAANQTSSGGVRVLLEEAEMVGFGTDYWGLSESDLSAIVTEIMPNFGNFDQLGERLMQGTLNSLILMKTFAPGGSCAELEEMRIDVEGTMEPTMNADELYYYGISQGGIMGGTLAALSDTIDRYVLQVGAISYSTMVRRSKDFGVYEGIMQIWYPEKIDRDWLVVSTQNSWSLAEPAAYAPHIVGDALPGVDNSGRRVLYQVSRYDTEVPNVASDIAARTMGIGAFDSSVYEPWNVEIITEDTAENAYVIFHLDDVEPLPMGTIDVMGDNSAHGDLRYQSVVIDQIDQFSRPDGVIVDTCPSNSCLLDNERR